MYTHEDLGNLAAEPTAGVRMETSEYETPGANSGNLKLPTGVEKWNLGRFRFSPPIVALSSDVSAVSPPLPLSVCMHLRCVLVVTMIIDSVLSLCARVCAWLYRCFFQIKHNTMESQKKNFGQCFAWRIISSVCACVRITSLPLHSAVTILIKHVYDNHL